MKFVYNRHGWKEKTHPDKPKINRDKTCFRQEESTNRLFTT